MYYLTDRKRAVGMGSVHSGTGHFWAMKLSSMALLPLIPLFLLVFLPVFGKPHEVVLDQFGRPFPALVVGLTIVCGFVHFKDGARMLIEDYMQGTARKMTIIAVTCLCYAAAVTGVFAIARMAF